MVAVRKTSDDKLAGEIRLLLAMLFLMTGVMKLVVPMLAEAWSGQLLAAGLPLYSITRWTVPLVEIGVGAVLGDVGDYTSQELRRIHRVATRGGTGRLVRAVGDRGAVN